MFRNEQNGACQKHESTTHSSARLPLPQPVCLLSYSCLLLPCFSHIADMPGLACLDRLCTEGKSNSSPVCDCTTAARALQRSALRKGRVWYGAGAGMAGTTMWAVGNKVTHGVFCGTFQAGLFLSRSFREKRGVPDAVESEDACCFHFPH